MAAHPRHSLYPGAQAMSSSSTNPSIPNPALPISEQLMQLDQAITLTLQEIDQNFATAHQIVTSKILPAVNRYGIASARTWQGAKSWKHFFEVSANVALSARQYDDDSYDQDEDNTTTYNGDAVPDVGSESQATINGSEAGLGDASPSFAESQLFDESHDNTLLSLPSAKTPQASSHKQVNRSHVADVSNEADQFYSTLGKARASSPPRFSDATMAAAARREADKRKQNEQTQTSDLPNNKSASMFDPIESPFERLRRDLSQDLGARGEDDTMDQSVLAAAHNRQRAIATQSGGSVDKAYYDNDLIKDETVKLDRRTLADAIENLDILGSRTDKLVDADLSAASSIAPPPQLSKHIRHQALSSVSPKKKLSATPRARGPLLHKVLTSEQRKRHGRTSNSKPNTSYRLETTPKSLADKNPFSQPASVRMWDGIVDLRKTPLNVKMGKAKTGASASRTSREKRTNRKDGRESASEWDSDSDNDSLGWPEGMSPPVTMQFSVPQSKYAKTPAKEAAKMLVDDVLKSVGASSPAFGRWARTKPAGPIAMSFQDPESSAKSAAGPVGTPLQRTKKEAKVLLKAASAAAGHNNRRDSMPTPPTLTKRGPPVGAARPRLSTTPQSTPLVGSGSFGAHPASGLQRGQTSLDRGGVGTSTAAMLLDVDEGLEIDDEEENHDGLVQNVTEAAMTLTAARDGSVAKSLDTKPSTVALTLAGGGDRRLGLNAEDDDDDEDEDDDEDDDDDDDDDESDEDDLIGGSGLSSAAKYSSSGSANQVGGQTDHSGWTNSTLSSLQSSKPGGRSIEDDTLFGVPKHQAARLDIDGPSSSNQAANGQNPFNRLSKETGVHPSTLKPEFKVWGHVDEMGTVHGGRPLIDRDDTYSAPSPTPMHLGQVPR